MSNASSTGGAYSLSRLGGDAGCGTSPGSATEVWSSAAASELTITGVSEARNDEGVVIEVVVDRGGDDVQVEFGFAQALNAFGRGERAHDRDRNWRAASGQQGDRVDQRATRGEHRVDHDHRPATQRLGQLVDVWMGLKRR